MAYTQSHQPGVIRCTQDYLRARESVAPDSQAPESPATGSPATGSPPHSPEGSEDARVPSPISNLSGDDDSSNVSTTRENPREVRNRAEKMRRDRLNEAVAELASMVPPVVAARRKIDKTTVLRLTAHYLRAHQYVFGDSIARPLQQHFNPASMLKVLGLFNGFLITTTYRGIIVVVSQNVNQYLGYTELDLLGQNLLNITHEADRAMLLDQLMPRTQNLGANGELMIPDEPDGARKVKEALAGEKRRFVIRLKKLGQRSEPSQYVTCHVEGSLRKSDRACRSNSRCCPIVRRARARTENPCSSGNDIVFIGMVRPTSESFINESALESYRMEYRTRHSIDGEIIQCESRIALVTGYMIQEVSGVNAMNFMHRDDVRWVIIALREMYDQHRLFGESCYRLITKCGQPIYMRTRGCLDVDQDSRAVTSFVCTNTVVTEEEGKKLIKLMKKKFSLLVNSKTAAIEEIEDDTNYDEEEDEDQPAAVEDPRRLEQVILHLVTNLPSPTSQDTEEEPSTSASPDRKSMSPHRLTIIPPNKERIVSAIEKVYGVIKTFQKDSKQEENENEQTSKGESSHNIPKYIIPEQTISVPSQERQIVPFQSAHASKYVDVANNIVAQPMPNNESDNDFNSNSILNAVESPDMGYFDDSSSPFSTLSSILTNFNKACDEIYLEHQAAELRELEFHDVEFHGGADSVAKYDGGGYETAEYQGADYDSAGGHSAQDDGALYDGAESAVIMPILHNAEESNVLQAMPQASTSNISCGTKRPNDSEDIELACKKKITEFEYTRQNDPTSDFDSPLANLFDEFDFASEAVDLAVKSLEYDDLMFPNLLVASEVHEILSKLEKEANAEGLRDFNLSDYE